MFKRLFSLIVFAAVMGFAQFAPEPQVADIKLMMDPKTEKPMIMDFSTHLSGISDPGILFAHFSNRPLLIYYFSPKCPHCQKHFPEIQNLIKEYESKGLTGIAIGLNGGIKKNDIRLFIDQYHAVIPVFQDTDSKFRHVLPLRNTQRSEHEPFARYVEQDFEEVIKTAVEPGAPGRQTV